jgi:hypothetical protein
MATRASRCDVLVVGGGAAGVAAALAAARAGARTRLVERYGFLGGMATAAMVGTVCGLYATGPSGPPRLLNEGIAAEVEGRLRAAGSEPLRRGRTVALPYVPATLARILDDLVSREPALRLGLHATCAGAEATATRLERVRLVGWRGAEDVEPRAVVDASGDAIVAWHAAVATETPAAAERQLASIVFVLDGVARDAVGGARTVAVLRALHAGERAGRLPVGCRLASFRATGRPGEVVVKLALDALDADGTVDELTSAELAARRRVDALAAFLAASVGGFEGARVSHVAPQVGVRESRRIAGVERLERADVLGARKRADGVARAAWPIELWEAGADGARYEYLPDDDWYDVPRGCLEHKTCANLLAAGRCMSATHEAMGSARVIGTCLAVGEAAGRLAAERAR